MRVAHVLTSGEVHATGIGRIVENLARNLDPSRFQLSAWFLSKRGPVSERLRRAGVDVISTEWDRGWRDAAGMLRFARAVRSEHIDIVHLHMGGDSSRLAARALGRAKVVAHFHSLAEESGRGGTGPRKVRGAHLVIANSHATANSLTHCDPLVVHPGIVLAPRHKPRPAGAMDAVNIGVAGRLVPVKGIDCLIRAVALLRRDFRNVFLHVAGSGIDQSRLRYEAISAGIADRVRFIGWRDDIAAVMSEWDIYAQPSVAEGFGIAALEAMAAGLPVVATDVGGLPELVDDGVTGWLVPPRDPESLAGRLDHLVRDLDARERMGTAGRSRAATHFSVEQEASAIQSAYERLLS